MKKLNNFNTYSTMLLAALVFIFVVAQFISYKAEDKVDRTNGEVVLVDSTLMQSHSWEEAAFDITCVDSLDCENEDGYFWCIYDSPDQFESVLCVSMDLKTYEKLQSVLRKMRQSNYAHSKALEADIDRFHLYYGQCEETVLMFE